MDEPSAIVSFFRFTVAGRTYELVPFRSEKGEFEHRYRAMQEQIRELRVHTTGEEDCQFILDHQDEIPPEVQRKFRLVFAGWRHSKYEERIACLYFDSERWWMRWRSIADRWEEGARFVRRVW